METKWYSDFWNLLTQPFKGGIDQVVQYGTLKKGFLGTALLWAIPYILIGLFGGLLFPLLPRNEFTMLGMLIGAGIGVFFILAYIASIIWSFVMVAVGSYVFNWVAVKMGGTDDVQSVMKVQWYLQGYEVLLCTCVYIIVFILMAIFGGLFGSSTLAEFIYSLGSIAIFVLSVWVGLELMARQTMLTKMKVFIAGIVTSVIFIVISLIFMALLGGCVSLVGR